MPEVKRYRKFNFSEADWTYTQRKMQRELDDENEKLKVLLKDDKERRAVATSMLTLSAALSIVVLLGIVSIWALCGAGVLFLCFLGVASAGDSTKIQNQRLGVRICETNITEWFMSDAEDVSFKDDTPVPVEITSIKKELEGKKFDPFRAQMYLMEDMISSSKIRLHP